MIATSFPRPTFRPTRGTAPPAATSSAKNREEHSMNSVTSGTFVGAGSFSCEHCGYTLTLVGSDTLSACPGCGGQDFARASLFSTERIPAGAGKADVQSTEGTLLQPPAPGRDTGLASAREQIDRPGD